MSHFEDRAAEYRRQLIDFLRRRLPRDEQDLASDFVQEALLEAQERADLLRALTPRETLAWLVTVLKFKAANGIRAHRRQPHPAGSSHDLGSGGSERLVDRSSSPARAAEQRERGRRIERALASLTAAQRLAIVLRFYAGWTLDEIARQTGSNRVSVYKRIDRGLRRLQRTGGLTVADLA